MVDTFTLFCRSLRLAGSLLGNAVLRIYALHDCRSTIAQEKRFILGRMAFWLNHPGRSTEALTSFVTRVTQNKNTKNRLVSRPFR